MKSGSASSHHPHGNAGASRLGRAMLRPRSAADESCSPSVSLPVCDPACPAQLMDKRGRTCPASAKNSTYLFEPWRRNDCQVRPLNSDARAAIARPTATKQGPPAAHTNHHATPDCKQPPKASRRPAGALKRRLYWRTGQVATRPSATRRTRCDQSSHGFGAEPAGSHPCFGATFAKPGPLRKQGRPNAYAPPKSSEA